MSPEHRNAPEEQLAEQEYAEEAWPQHHTHQEEQLHEAKDGQEHHRQAGREGAHARQQKSRSTTM